MSRAFTYLEILVALLITGLLALAVGSVLLTSLRAERAAQAEREARLLFESAATRGLLGMDPAGALENARPGWHMTPAPIERPHDTNAPHWRAWDLESDDPAAPRARLALQFEGQTAPTSAP